MVKYLLIIFNSLLVFIYSLFSNEGPVTVTGTMTDKLVAGIEAPVELTIKKGDLTGFAKLQVQLPEGVTINKSEEMGATYSFDEGLAKWVWASLPPEEDLVLKFTVLAEKASEKKSITAKFLYVKENDKQEVEMTPLEFVVVEGDGLAAAAPIGDSTVTAPKKDSTILAVVPEVSHFDPPGNIAAERKITAGEGNEKTISVTIHKGLTKGFARFSDELPANVNVKEGETDGASFTVADGKIKFVWVNVPDKTVLQVSYKITTEANAAVILKGEYSYLENNQSKKIILPPETLNLEPPVVVKTEPEAPKTDVVVVPEQPVEEKKPEEIKTEPVITKKESQTTFMVQVGAFNKKKVTAKQLQKKFTLTETIKSEMQGGYSKFMVGDHTDYKEARDHRDRLISENKIKTAFVVAYNHGKRITVQEALMITKQRWLK